MRLGEAKELGSAYGPPKEAVEALGGFLRRKHALEFPTPDDARDLGDEVLRDGERSAR